MHSIFFTLPFFFNHCPISSGSANNHRPLMPPMPTSRVKSPRRSKTGKRGCPQQFPKKLYDMIEIESNVPSPIVTWTETGRAFRIVDVSQFTAKTLTMYFKTSKFSSFQRNLNLVSRKSGLTLPCGDVRSFSFSCNSMGSSRSERASRVIRIFIQGSRRATCQAR